MAFNNYYLGWKNGGEDFYSLKDLISDIMGDDDLINEIKNGNHNNYTIIKENTSSRTFYNASIVGDTVTLIGVFHERMIDGAYGS